MIRRPLTAKFGTFAQTNRYQAGGSELTDIFGRDVSARLARGLRRLLAEFSGSALEAARLIGPTVEGVGWYPVHDVTLSSSLQGLWVAGDATGSFRGLTAALVSGYIAGQAIVDRSLV